MNREKIKGYLGLSRKAGYLVIGVDNLKGYDKKLYLILVDKNLSNTLQKTVNRFDGKVKVEIIENLNELVEIENCKIVGIRNYGLANEIMKNIRGE